MNLLKASERTMIDEARHYCDPRFVPSAADNDKVDELMQQLVVMFAPEK